MQIAKKKKGKVVVPLGKKGIEWESNHDFPDTSYIGTLYN